MHATRFTGRYEALEIHCVNRSFGIEKGYPVENSPLPVSTLEFIEITALVPEIGDLSISFQTMDDRPVRFHERLIPVKIDQWVRKRMNGKLQLREDGHDIFSEVPTAPAEKSMIVASIGVVAGLEEFEIAPVYRAAIAIEHFPDFLSGNQCAYFLFKNPIDLIAHKSIAMK